jgi:hypothetical protein
MARTSTKRSAGKSSSATRRSSGNSKRSSGNSNRSSGNSKSKQDEADRYRRAAEDALQQLDWAIGYLHGIHKTGISKALAKNRSYIRRSLMGEPEEPLPDQETSET